MAPEEAKSVMTTVTGQGKDNADETRTGATLTKPIPLHLKTPLRPFRAPYSLPRPLLLKLENIQPSGSFKIRGLGYLCQAAWADGARHFVSSSGGNAGAAVAYAGNKLGAKVTVVVPTTTPTFMLNRLKAYNAKVIVHGDVWDKADVHARYIAHSSKEKTEYVSPFDDARIWEGCSSIIDEIQTDLQKEKPGAVIVSVGGGGLFLGVARGLERVGWGDVPIVAVETEGTASFKAMFENKGKAVRLHEIKGLAKSLGALMVSEECGRWVQSGRKIFCTLVSDREAVEACGLLAISERSLVEPACGAALAAAMKSDVVKGLPRGPIVVVICGGNMASPHLLEEWANITQAQLPDLY